MANQDFYTLLSTSVQIANDATLSPSARLKALVRLIKKSFRLHSANIFLPDPDRRTLCRLIPATGREKALDPPVPVGEQAAGLCALRGEAVFACDGLTPENDGSKLRKRGTLFLPILNGRQAAGVLALELPEGSTIAESLPVIIRDIVHAMAGLVRTDEISHRSDQRVQNLVTLNELWKALHHPLPIKELLPFALETIHGYSGACCTVLRIFNWEGFTPKVLKAYRKKCRTYLPTLLEIEARATTGIRSRKTPHLTIDLVADEDIPLSYISVPLQHEENTFGCLTFFGKRGRTGRRNFTEEDREFFTGMTNLLATALVRSEYSRRMDRLVSENEQKLKELSLLYRVSNAMHTTTRINRLIHLNLSALVSGESQLFERAMLFLINQRAGIMQGMLGITTRECPGSCQSTDNDEDSLYSRWEISDEDMDRQQNSEFCRMVKASRIPLEKSGTIPSRAVLEKRLIVADGSTKQAHAKVDVLKKFNLASFAAVPIIAKDEAVALLILDNPFSGKTITTDDLRFLQMLANQAGIAIENSMLYNRIEDANREFTEIRQRLLQGERLAALGETAASIAHELKTPLVSIGGFARRLLRKQEPDSCDWHYADTIAREADRLQKMLNDILFFTRRATICYTPCILQDIIEESLAVVAELLDENGIRISTRFSRTDLEFLGDFQQIKQVCINLFLNAGEAMKGGGTLYLSAAPTLLDDQEAVSLKVRDTGSGIPAEVLPDILNPFFTTKDEGTGLGLPIAHRIITNHGGILLVENRPGGGAEFRVILPTQPQFPSFQQRSFPV